MIGAKPAIEFTDADCILEFLSPPGRTFHPREWRRGDRRDDDAPDPSPVLPERIEA
jgi:hypothetical protein